jgi:hypothetical protein
MDSIPAAFFFTNANRSNKWRSRSGARARARARVSAYAYEKSHSRFNWPAIARRRVVGTEQKRGGSAI